MFRGRRRKGDSGKDLQAAPSGRQRSERLRLPKSWPEDAKAEAIRLHAARSVKFDPAVDPEHRCERLAHLSYKSHFVSRLLRSFWRVMNPSSDFKLVGKEWTRCGFQGNNPCTDVRAGGALSVEALEHFATYHTQGILMMIEDLRRLEQSEGAAESFYPLSTTSIVICACICDAIGISAGMQGPIPAEKLKKLVRSRPRSAITPLLTPPGSENGFNECFSFVLCQFHTKFMNDRVSSRRLQFAARTTCIRISARTVSWVGPIFYLVLGSQVCIYVCTAHISVYALTDCEMAMNANNLTVDLRMEASYLLSKQYVDDAVTELEDRASRCSSIAELRRMYCEGHPKVAEMLVRAGGETVGWRLARGLVRANKAHSLRTRDGVVRMLHRAPLSSESLLSYDAEKGDDIDQATSSPTSPITFDTYDGDHNTHPSTRITPI